MAKVIVDWCDQEFPLIDRASEKDLPYETIYDIPDELFARWEDLIAELRPVLVEIEKLVDRQNTELDRPSWGWMKALPFSSIADHTELKFEKE